MLKEYLSVALTESKGRGVVTSEAIEANTVIEIAPVLVMSGEDRIHLDKTLLHDYIFEWGPDKTQCCMALGLIPMYNHSYASNSDYYMDFDESMMIIKTVRPIKAGEEITINYNGDWNDEKKLWFDVK
ncbi:MAG: SET domain-containing protein-lysine N-methyltransferase [Rhizobacter sp.]|nr:SET domain-containing protein-lysine N-methyltransferase [Ferruginibacter sp.]